MNTCRECGCSVRSTPIERYDADNELKQMGVVLVNAVRQHVCEGCGASTVVIPDLPGLLAAVAVYRAISPWKLQGHEIKFLRKAMEIPATEVADLLEVSQETVSRWENDKIPMGPANEKLLRMLTAYRLEDKAPGVHWDPEEIGRMKINAVRDVNVSQTLTLHYMEVLRHKKDKEPEGVWRERRVA